jgi:hypothetical protein
VSKWLQAGFWLVTGFIEHLQIVTTSNYTAIANSHWVVHYSTFSVFSVCCVFTSRCLVTDLNNVFCFRTHVLIGWRLHHNYRLSTQLHSTPLHWLTPRLAAISHQPPIRLTVVSRLSRNRSCSALSSLRMDNIENTSPNSFSIVASRSYRSDLIQTTIPLLLVT